MSSGHIILLPTFIIKRKAAFQLQVNENTFVLFFTLKFTDFDGAQGVRGPQLKNGWSG
jgi:hypothetical protein